MTDQQQREAARQFFYKWKGRGKEDEDARSYWIDLLQGILGVDRVTDRVQFEKKVADKTGKKRIDVYIPETSVLIEQKSLGIDLDKPQAGHDGKTPYEQAKEYDNLLPYQEHAKWIVTSNFSEIWIYDMSVMRPEPVKIQLSELQEKFHLLDFLISKKVEKITEEVELSKKAGELVGKIRDRFLTQYNDPLAKRTQKSLNILCVRLVFCFYAEDAGLFGKRDAFCSYLTQYQPKDMRGALLELFKVLDTPIDERADLYLSDELAAFPYVNGGLFKDENIVVPKFTQEIKDTLVESSRFDWSKISPTIFGAVFESTLNPETRRAGGMHYTSIENIHKVIDPLFLDDLKAEFDEIKKIAVVKTRNKKLEALQDKLASLVFLDPAAGSGNFLTESFLSLRRLENEIIALLTGGQIVFGEVIDPIKVSISQFYGIEINDFAVAVAQTALWIAESQMIKETEDIVHAEIDFLPLKTNANIAEKNALQIDWNEIVPKEKLNYIMGNPPFVGYSLQTKEQKQDITSLYIDEKGKPYKTAGKIDYVSGWYWKAAEMMHGTEIRAAFVSTNSITQGEQVAGVWKPLYERFGIHINFAHRTFRWDSEASLMAHVHCVIIGFSVTTDKKPKIIYTSDRGQHVNNNINAYLIDGPDVFLESLTKPICDVPAMRSGGKPVEGGNLIFTENEKKAFLEKEPKAERYFRPFMGSDDFINGRGRWCLWLVNVSPKELRSMPLVLERVEAVRKFRLSSSKVATREFANQPARFMEIKQPDSNYLMIPATSSEKRRYIPIGYLSKDVVASNAASFVPDATLYHFGILTSNVHMAWMRVVCGRLEMRYRYSVAIVYNNFPWPNATDEQKQQIEQTAQGILDARALYPDSSLADLYDPLTMPPELRRAHTANDRAVMKAYGMPIKETDEAACVAWLMRLYQAKVAETK